MAHTEWNFKIKVQSKTLFFTKDMKKEIETKLLESGHIYKIEIIEVY